MKVYSWMAIYEGKKTVYYSGLDHAKAQEKYMTLDKSGLRFIVASVHDTILWTPLIDNPKYAIENFKSIDAIVYMSFKPKPKALGDGSGESGKTDK